MTKKDKLKSEKNLSEQLQDLLREADKYHLGQIKSGAGNVTFPISAPSCPNCGYCPHCGRGANNNKYPPFNPNVPYCGDNVFLGNSGTGGYDAAGHSAWY